MINREARGLAAELVQAFRDGEITNRELERSWPDDGGDRGVKEVAAFLWSLSSDLHEHHISSEDRQHEQTILLLENSVRFLLSTEEYTYPFGATIDVKYYPKWAVWLSFGIFKLHNDFCCRKEERYWREMRKAGDVSAWPSTFAKRSI